MVFDFISNFVDVWVWKEFLNQRTNFCIESCREQQLLAVTNRTHDATHRLDESKITHVVCFIDNDRLDCRQVNNLLSHEVFKATRSCNDDVGATAHRDFLATLRNTTVNTNGEETNRTRKALQGALNLVGEFTSRSKHQRTSLTRLALNRTGSKKLGHDWHAERNGLTRTGLSTAENVTTLNSSWDGRGLNWERRNCTHSSKSGKNLRVKVHLFKSVFDDRFVIAQTLQTLKHYIFNESLLRSVARTSIFKAAVASAVTLYAVSAVWATTIATAFETIARTRRAVITVEARTV